VNDLIASLRKTAISSSHKTALEQKPSLPPQIREILAQPETPTPVPRRRPRVTGYAGPPPPRSWLESRHAPKESRVKSQARVRPTDVYHLPGIKWSNGRRLQDMCMRQMAREWEDIREYEQNNLAQRPSSLRMELLSFIAVDGPDEGVGFEGLRDLIIPRVLEYEESYPHDSAKGCVELQTPISMQKMPDFGGDPFQAPGKVNSPESPLEDWDDDQSSTEFEIRKHNDNLYRLDLSGAIGYSVSLKQLTSFIERPSLSIAANVPHLTHLSLAYPAPTVSWRNLLTFSKHLPALTHLSLAYWPTPSLTANSKTAVMSSPYGRDLQYGGTNFYSHSLENDFREAADILRRLAGRLYGLEYLDVSGCIPWVRALRWNGLDTLDSRADEMGIQNGALEGIDWGHQWLKLTTLKLNSLSTLTETSGMLEVNNFIRGVKEAEATQVMLSWWARWGKRKGTWVEIARDNHRIYHDLWRGMDSEAKRKREALNGLDYSWMLGTLPGWKPPVIPDVKEENWGGVDSDDEHHFQ
jgi:hypothetical protein